MGKTRTRRQNLLKKKGKQEEDQNPLANLPEHMVFMVIEKVPSSYLHDNFRHVSKSWHDVISSPEFTVKNTNIHDKSELLLQLQVLSTWKWRWVYRLRSLEMMDDDQNQKAAPEIKIRNILPRMGMVRSSCNGLVLVLDFKYNERQLQEALMQVKNLLTKCCLTLPKCPSDCTHEDEVCGVALGFDPSTNEYKVVHICGNGYSFEIFTLGCSDNAWRMVPGPFKEPNEQPFDVETFEWGDPASVNGRVMYWYVGTNEYLVSMNISDEKAYKTYLPKLDREIEIGRFSFMEMGGNLSFWYQISSTQIDVWILKDLHGRNWLKIHSMMMESINYKYPNTKPCSTSNKFNPSPDFMKLIPVAALRDGEVIVFQHESFRYVSHHLYFYDIQRMELTKFKCKCKITSRSIFIPHRSSLVHWEDKKELLPKELLPNG